MSKIWLLLGTRAVLFAIVIGIAGGADRGYKQVHLTRRMYVRLTDFVPLPEKVREESEATVVSLFAKAGVQLDFVECASPERPCGIPPGPEDYWVQIRRDRPLGLDEDSAGFAVLVPSLRPSDSYATVWFPKVEDASRELQASLACVLGATLAHEIGHLALHSTSHSQAGIMKGRLDRKQVELMGRGELAFTSAEAARLMVRP